MLDPDVTLTDYLLAILAAYFAYIIHHRGTPETGYRSWFALFFLAAGAAPLLGGTMHGFFPQEGTLAHDGLWVATLLAVGIAALAGWTIGARLILAERPARAVSSAAFVLYLAYAGIVLFVSRDFLVAIVHYLPATLFLLVAFAARYRRTGERPLAAAAVGLALTFVAAAVQQLEIPLHPTYFDHNALYHVVQAAGLWMVFVGARRLAGCGEVDAPVTV